MTDSISTMMRYQMQARHYPGALVHIENQGSVITHTAMGKLKGTAAGQQSSGSDLVVETRFRIASLTKGMVSLVALALIDQGRLELDAPVESVLPTLAGQRLVDGSRPLRPPSLRDCLRHTAGFGYIGEVTDPVVRGAFAEAPIEGGLALMERSQFQTVLAARPLSAEPGSRFQYGFSTDVIGLMIEQVTGRSLFAVLREFLFDPLGMTNTAFHIDPSQHEAMPTAFPEDKNWHGFVDTFNKADQFVADNGFDPMACEGVLQSGGGGLISTVADVAAYARLVANGGQYPGGTRLLSEALFKEAMSNQLGPTVPGPYNYTGGGFGFGLAAGVRNDWAPAAVPAEPGEFAWSGVTGHTLFIGPGRGYFGIMLSSNTASRVVVRLEFRRAAARELDS